MKKALLFSTLCFLFFASMVLTVSKQCEAVDFCDNFGKTWTLNLTGVDTLEGIRDTLDLNNCGAPQYARGVISTKGSAHFVVTSMAPDFTVCLPVIWDAIWTGDSTGSGNGTWYNGNGAGSSGSFTMTVGACGLDADSASGFDPTQK